MARLVCGDLTVVADDGRRRLAGVDLAVEDASCCAVMGPSGAGKTTLLQAVAGLVDHDGTIEVDGRSLDGVDLHRRGVGLLFQQPRLFPTMSVGDNVAYPLKLRRVDRRRRRASAVELLAEVGLESRVEARPHELSGGEQQRVALARALASAPDVLLLDEPLTGLDLPQRRDLVRLLARVRAERALTWVVVTHDPDDAATLGDTIAVLDGGHLVQHDLVDVVRDRPASALVAALSANPNRLVGRRTPSGFGPDPAAGDHWTIPAGRLRIGPGSSGETVVRASVAAIERRGPVRVAVLRGPGVELEVPITGPGASDRHSAPATGDTVEVAFEAGDLWPLAAAPASDRPIGPSAHQEETA